MRKIIRKQSGLLVGLVLVSSISLFKLPDAEACTRIFWNTNPDLLIVGRNEDYVTASHPTFVASPRGMKRVGTSDNARKSRSINWTVKYGLDGQVRQRCILCKQPFPQ
jgi:penicillin V acylase-like amidase (Ntn superfamily)